MHDDNLTDANDPYWPMQPGQPGSQFVLLSFVPTGDNECYENPDPRAGDDKTRENG
jgi:hypothetical protein